MSDTNYTDYALPPISAAWLNDVNQIVYRFLSASAGVGGPAASSITSLLANLGTVQTVTALRAGSVPTTLGVIQTLGYKAFNDNGGFQYFWDPTASTADNGVTFIKPSSVSGNGRWRPILFSVPEFPVEAGGATGQGASDDSAAFNSVFSLLMGTVPIGAHGVYRFDNPVTWAGSTTQIPSTEGYATFNRTGGLFLINHNGTGFLWGNPNIRSFGLRIYGGDICSGSLGSIAINWTAPSAGGPTYNNSGHVAEYFLNIDYVKNFDFSYYGFWAGLLTDAINNQGTSYCEFRPLAINDCGYWWYATHGTTGNAADVGFCNENMMCGEGSLSYSSSCPNASAFYGFFFQPRSGSTTPMDDNKVIGPALECAMVSNKPNLAMWTQFGGYMDAVRIENFPVANAIVTANGTLGERGGIFRCTEGITPAIFTDPSKVDFHFYRSKGLQGGGDALPGSGASCTLSVASGVVSIGSQSGGSGYLYPVPVDVSGDGVGARVFTTVSGGALTFVLMSGGINYTTATANLRPTFAVNAIRQVSSGANPLMEGYTTTNARTWSVRADGSMKIGSDSAASLKGIFSGAKSVAISGLANGAIQTATIIVNSATVNDFAKCTVVSGFVSGVILYGEVVSSASTVTVNILNNTGSALTATLGVRAVVWQTE